MADTDPLSPPERLAVTIRAAQRIPELKGARPGERPLHPRIYEQMYTDRQDRVDLALRALARDLDWAAQAEAAAANEHDAASLAAQWTADNREREPSPARGRSALDRAEALRSKAGEHRARAKAHAEKAGRARALRSRLPDLAEEEARAVAPVGPDDPHHWLSDEHKARWHAVNAQVRAVRAFVRDELGEVGAM